MGGALSRPAMTRSWHDLFFFSFLRSAAHCDASISSRRQLTQSGAVEESDLAEPPALVRLPAEPGLRLAPASVGRMQSAILAMSVLSCFMREVRRQREREFFIVEFHGTPAKEALRSVGSGSMALEGTQTVPLKATVSLVNLYHDAVITPSSPRERGPREIDRCMNVRRPCVYTPFQQAQWYAFYRRQKRYCSPRWGTSIRCCRRICSRLRSAQVGICRVSRDYGRCNPPRKAPQEMAPGVETRVD